MNVTQEYHFRVPLSLIFKPSLSAIVFVMVISCSSTLNMNEYKEQRPQTLDSLWNKG